MVSWSFPWFWNAHELSNTRQKALLIQVKLQGEPQSRQAQAGEGALLLTRLWHVLWTRIGNTCFQPPRQPVSFRNGVPMTGAAVGT
jgi:hypothetical protein